MVTLHSLDFEGLFSYKDKTKVKFGNNTVIVGPNNSGKTNIIRALKLAVDSLFINNTWLDDTKRFHNYDGPARITLNITLSDAEAEKILDYLCCYVERQSNTIHIVELTDRSRFIELLKDVEIKLEWSYQIRRYGARPSVVITFKKLGMFIIARDPSYSICYVGPYEPDDKLNPPRQSQEQHLAEILKDIEKSTSLPDALRQKLETTEFIEIREMTPNAIRDDASAEAKRRLADLFIAADRPLDSNQYITFVVLMGALLHKAFLFARETRNFEPKHELIQEKYLSDDGSNLHSYLLYLKTNHYQELRDRFVEIQEAFQQIYRASNLQFDATLRFKERKPKQEVVGAEPVYDPDFAELVITDTAIGNQTTLSDAGAGVGETIFLLTKCLGIKNSVIVLDEPALHLHQTQINALVSHITKSLIKNNNQLIVITHSSALLNIELFKHGNELVSVRRQNGISGVFQPTLEKKEWLEDMIPKLKHLLKPEILFAKAVVLTEGPSDKNFLEAMSSALGETDEGMNLEANDVAVIDVGGYNGFKTFSEFLEHFAIPYIILADKNASSIFDEKDLTFISTKRSVSEVSTDTRQVYVIEDGNLENLLKEMDEVLYNKCLSESYGKPAVAYNFVKQLKRDANSFDSLKMMLKHIVTVANS